MTRRLVLEIPSYSPVYSVNPTCVVHARWTSNWKGVFWLKHQQSEISGQFWSVSDRSEAESSYTYSPSKGILSVCSAAFDLRNCQFDSLLICSLEPCLFCIVLADVKDGHFQQKENEVCLSVPRWFSRTRFDPVLHGERLLSMRLVHSAHN